MSVQRDTSNLHKTNTITAVMPTQQMQRNSMTTVMDCSVYSTHLDFGGILFSTNHKSAPIAAKRLGKRMSSHSGPGRQTYFSAF